MDLAKLADAIAPLLRAEIEKATEPLRHEIEVLKGREIPDAPTLQDVVSALLVSEELKTLCDLQANESVAVHLAENPPKDGESPDPEQIVADVYAKMASSLDELASGLEDRVKAVESRPPPKDGEDGVSPDPDEIAKTVAGAFERRFADLSLTWDRQARDMAQKAIEAMPEPKDGENGMDGLGLDDLSFEFDGERTLSIKMSRGELVKEATMRFPVPIYRGVYVDGKDYERGDTMTWGGSIWTALKDCPEGKPGTTDDWRLSVKRGQKGDKGDVVTLPTTVKVGK
jgi:hypothetical protein